VLLGALLGTLTGTRAERAVISLDGRWDFRLDPQDAGRKEQWFASGIRFTNTIRVPGAWQAQGYGVPSDKLYHNYVGKAWYQRQVQLPKLTAGRRLFLCFGGVHRSAEVWVNGNLMGGHLGYLSPFEFELKPPVTTNSSLTVTVCVDCQQHWETDCLTGCADIIDEMFTPWGGISGHVSLEARSAAWLEDVFVQPRAAPPGVVVTARVVGEKGLARRTRLAVHAEHERPVAAAETDVGPDGGLRFELEIPEARLWSPDSPYLYTARVDLLAGSLSPALELRPATPPPHSLDRAEVRFGLREIKIVGHDFYLNGAKLFLRGYGDDAIYPKTMAPPTDKALYRWRLAVAKEYGFNFVRHHSHFLPPEYYEAADEVEILVSPEFPIAYESYYRKANGPALDLYRSEWAAIIKRLRNHPSIFDWCMANEMWNSFPLAPELYRAAKTLDPARLALDSDGLFLSPFLEHRGDRDTLDFFSVLFDEFSLPLDKPDKHRFGQVPQKPVLSHETGNYVTVPRLDLIGLFKDNFKPFWLLPFRAKMEKLRLAGEAGQWSLNSERLYYLAHKLNEENLRRNPQISGYMWWLLQDYWTGANGLLDTYSRPKSIPPEAVRQFNAALVLLQEGLPLTCSARHPLETKLLVSNYTPGPLHAGKLTWIVRLGSRLLAQGGENHFEAGQGELAEAATVGLDLPSVAEPEKLTLEAELRCGSLRARNNWSAWVYPEAPAGARLTVPLFAGPEMLQGLQPFGAQPLPAKDSLPARAVYVVSRPGSNVLAAVETGACLFCLTPENLFVCVTNRFKPAWWLGSPKDCNAGTVVYPHPLTRPLAPDGWCDLGWYHLLEGAQAVLLNDFPAQPEVLVRGLDVHTVCRSKALLFQARLGRGSIVVCGLRLKPDAQIPERAWLLNRLLEYCGTFPQPKAELPASFLRDRLGQERPNQLPGQTPETR
jgi:beta-galactosidase